MRALQLDDARRRAARERRQHASTPATVDVPAPRGAILDRNGDDPRRRPRPPTTSRRRRARRATRAPSRAKLAPLLHVSGRDDRGRARAPDLAGSYTAARAPGARRRPRSAIKALEITGHRAGVRPAARLPATYLAAQVLGGVGTSGGGARRHRVRVQHGARRHPRRPARRLRRPRPADRRARRPTPVAGQTVQLTLDAALQQNVEHVLAADRRKFRPLRRDGDRDGPADNAILAMANWPRVNANDPAQVGAGAELRGRAQLRAGLDLQGRRDRRRARPTG